MRHLIALLFASISLFSYAQIDWDFPYNPDSDNDGYIYSEDLLDLLAIYGQEYSSDELYLSQDSSRMIIQVGQSMHKVECFSACQHLHGSWEVTTRKDLYYFYDFLTEDLVTYDSFLGIGIENYDGLENMWFTPTIGSHDLDVMLKNTTLGENGDGNIVILDPPLSRTLNPNSDADMHGIRHKSECWCATNQRPKVEWHRISNNDFESNKDELSQNGWRLHTIDGPGGHYLFWRWAE